MANQNQSNHKLNFYDMEKNKIVKNINNVFKCVVYKYLLYFIDDL